MRGEIISLVIILGLGAAPAKADTVDALLDKYRSAGATQAFDAARGKSLWFAQHAQAKTGKPVNCSSCHTSDLTRRGRHVRTGKVIDPLAPSANPGRLTDAAKVEKWFKRNCKWTWGRKCSPQEKGDILMFLRTQ